MRDIDDVIHAVGQTNPAARSRQLEVAHPGADDDGIWFFWIDGANGDVQVESTNGMLPFIVETDKHRGVAQTTTVAETVRTIIEWLELPGGAASSCWYPREA